MEHLTAVVGEPVRIALESFGGAGYEWRLGDVPPGLRLEARESLPPEAGSPPGSPHRVEFALVAETEGTFVVTLTLQRPWESDAAQERVYEIEASPAQP